MSRLVSGFSNDSRFQVVHGPCQVLCKILALTKLSRIHLIFKRMVVAISIERLSVAPPGRLVCEPSASRSAPEAVFLPHPGLKRSAKIRRPALGDDNKFFADSGLTKPLQFVLSSL
jgi:hypothetical protein